MDIDGKDIAVVNAILAKYEDQTFQFANACLMHLAEREKINSVFTFDQRDFSVFRTAVGKPLEIVT